MDTKCARRSITPAFCCLSRCLSEKKEGPFVEPDATWLLPAIRTIHEQIRSAVTSAFESSNSEALSSVVDDSEGDTIFAVDRISESLLVELFEREIASRVPIVLIAEGLHGGSVVLPRGARES